MTDKIHWGGTEGPWVAREDETSPGYFPIKSGITNVCIMQQRNSDMGMPTDPTRKQCQTNARAIAEVPAMVRALQELLEVLERELSEEGGRDYLPEELNAIAILARIDGE